LQPLPHLRSPVRDDHLSGMERVLTNDPGIGVARHADAGYERARETAEREGVRLPMPSPGPRDD
ncbi:MAG: hypothetical protein P8177_01755, partial [Gemmatimonadota bacterium]